MYDDDGNDVTPVPLCQLENSLAKGPSKGSVVAEQSMTDGTQVHQTLNSSLYYDWHSKLIHNNNIFHLHFQ